MLNFISLQFKNFMSYGNVFTTIHFNNSGTTLIIGEDLDNQANGSGANGTGKSAIIEALVFAVFGKALSDIGKDNLINNINKKDLETVVIFEKNKKFYKIHRGRRTKHGNFVKLYESNVNEFDDNDEITLDSIANNDRKIVEILGISFELFIRIVVFSANHIPFFSLPIRTGGNASQSGIIEELFELIELAKDGEKLKDSIKENINRLEIYQTKIESLIKEHKRLDTQKENTKHRLERWDKNNIKEMKELALKLSKIKNVDIDTEKKRLNELKKIKTELTKLESKQNRLESKISTNETIIEKKEIQLKHLVDKKCPYCLQEYKDNKEKIKECGQKIKFATKTINDSNEKLKIILDKQETILQAHDEISNLLTIQNIDELLEIKSEQKQIVNRIKELKVAVNPFIEPLDELDNTEIDPIDYTKINELTKLIEHQKFLHKLLTNKNSFVRKNLLNKNIPFLNSRLQYYLDQLGLPHVVEFNHDLSATISRFGKTLDFGNLSNGQQARVNLALSFTFRDVLQKINDKINVCILDECLDIGLDSIGVEMAAHMIKQKARDENVAIYIVSHRDEIDSAFDNILKVNMTDNFSNIAA